MAVSVKIKDRTKRRLETLRSDLESIAGRTVTFQDLLEAMSLVAVAEQERVLRALTGVRVPLPRDAIDKLMASPRSWGVPTDSRRVDEVLYSRQELMGQRRASRTKGR